MTGVVRLQLEFSVFSFQFSAKKRREQRLTFGAILIQAGCGSGKCWGFAEFTEN
jgi:hypothetical protein